MVWKTPLNRSARVFAGLRPALVAALTASVLAAPLGASLAQAATSPLQSVEAAVTGETSASSTPSASGTAATATTQAADPYGRETPRSMISALIERLADGDYKEAGNYFEDSANGTERAEQLEAVLNKGGSLNTFATLSDSPEGVLDDDLPASQEYVGNLGDKGKTPIMLTRSKAAGGTMIWRISRQTSDIVGRMNPKTTTLEDGGVEVAGASLKDWGILLGLAAAVFLGFQLLSGLVLLVARRLTRGSETSAAFSFAKAAMPPLSLFLATAVFQIWADSLPVSIVARQWMLKYIGIFAAIALTWFLMRLIDAISHVVIWRMETRGQRQVVSVVSLLRRAAKILLAFGVLVAILDTFGIDVTTGVAALGIGGIALALGAQKTVENLVGSISLIADKPVQIGDFCKIGDVLGTVEDIGIRSTRIRTLQRTVVTIPNGDLSTQKIENYARRDRFLFNPTIGVEYGIGSAKLLEAVETIESVLENHDRIARPGYRARFVAFGASSLDIAIFAYIEAADYDESLVIQQDLLLLIFARLERAGVGIAFPTRTLHLVREGSGEEDGAGSDAPLAAPRSRRAISRPAQPILDDPEDGGEDEDAEAETSGTVGPGPAA
ncbi:mechanosensitive ion channel family protein [Novosphingobium sp. 1949]|uniref:Mechanosensitive ion channel family protein n=1 Tax=Novosphingobium organovorum TaxID=2930092 RepID=A0ABT0BEP9_9SPHN|nr:mechanosensitive ion channel family protein [Novosphingobium organovorum]MCJ2183529.1 mechanosensitive ion channel family protein [Novosphingobium organovorum]